MKPKFFLIFSGGTERKRGMKRVNLNSMKELIVSLNLSNILHPKKHPSGQIESWYYALIQNYFRRYLPPLRWTLLADNSKL